MDEAGEIDPERRVANPHAWTCQGCGKRRQDFTWRFDQIVEIALVERIDAQTNSQGIEYRLIRRVALLKSLEAVAEQGLWGQHHVYTGSQVNTSAERCSG